MWPPQMEDVDMVVDVADAEGMSYYQCGRHG